MSFFAVQIIHGPNLIRGEGATTPSDVQWVYRSRLPSRKLSIRARATFFAGVEPVACSPRSKTGVAADERQIGNENISERAPK